MGLFSSFFGCGQPPPNSGGGSPDGQEHSFLTEASYHANRSKQAAMVADTMAELRKHDVTEGSNLKLEYFFYTDSSQKAEVLAGELTRMGYDGGHGIAAGDSNLYVITGWTPPMQMIDSVVVKWTEKMCDLGYRFDCEFDGWGTNPNQ